MMQDVDGRVRQVTELVMLMLDSEAHSRQLAGHFR